MSAEEWLTQRFGSDEWLCPMPGYAASRQFFLDTFGATLEAAWNAGKRGRELCDALMATPGGTRGWEIYFAYWLERGLFN